MNNCGPVSPVKEPGGAALPLSNETPSCALASCSSNPASAPSFQRSDHDSNHGNPLPELEKKGHCTTGSENKVEGKNFESGKCHQERSESRPDVPGGFKEDLCAHCPNKDWKKVQDKQKDEDSGRCLASTEEGSPCSGGGEGGLTPPPVRWAESLLHLLDDPAGVPLFKQFLLEETGSIDMLNFWFACNGLQLRNAGEIPQLVTIIWNQFIRNFAVKVSQPTYKAISDRINSKQISCHIFDEAQHEVEAEMSQTTYPSFLKSDLYLNYLDPHQQEGSGSPSSPSQVPVTGAFLPTVHEDTEYQNCGAIPHCGGKPKLTQDYLLATSRYRAAMYDRRKPEAIAGVYVSGKYALGLNPYHASYSSGHVVSVQDSELHSISSGTHTDDTLSLTDSSVDGMSTSFSHQTNPKYYKRQYQKMRENARRNRELALAASGICQEVNAMKSGIEPISYGGVFFFPRTHTAPKDPLPNKSPEEFARILAEKLEKLKRDQESQEKLQKSLWMITHSEDAPEELRKEHAVNSLPPSLLANKLCEKIPLEEHDQNQSILDEHVSRVWDSSHESSACSPSSPKNVPKSPSSQSKGGRGLCTYQFPHMLPISSSHSHHLPKVPVKGSRGHLPMSHSLPVCRMGGQGPQVVCSCRTSCQMSSDGCCADQIGGPHAHSKNRRRDKVPDAYSNFSSDSGNVADYYDNTEQYGQTYSSHSYLPKSRSMPEYIENHAGTSSDGGSSGSRRQANNTRKNSSKKTPADFTDSGVSVMSDSRPSLGPSVSSVERKNMSNIRRSQTQAIPVDNAVVGGMHCSGGGRAIPVDASAIQAVGSTAPSSRVPSSCGQHSSPAGVRESPIGHSQSSHHFEERRKNRNMSGSASKPAGQSTSHGDIPGGSGCPLKKQQHRSTRYAGDSLFSSSCYGGVPLTYQQEMTAIVYNFQDDAVPFVTKVPSRHVTLKKFKQNLPKKGNYRFFFKKYCEDIGIAYEEITDDLEELPIFDGRIFAQIRKAD